MDFDSREQKYFGLPGLCWEVSDKSCRPLDTGPSSHYFLRMPTTATPNVRPEIGTDEQAGLEPGYLVVCWNDPVNFMDYVTHVFQTVFGWERKKAERHMLEVHHKGKSRLVRESLEKAEFYVHRLQQYQLHATLERD
jgi:ATP-dependent Clp protease adaptor protein ClpS